MNSNLHVLILAGSYGRRFWLGTYRVLFEGPRFKVKHISVEPGKRLSLQYHHRG